MSPKEHLPKDATTADGKTESSDVFKRLPGETESELYSRIEREIKEKVLAELRKESEYTKESPETEERKEEWHSATEYNKSFTHPGVFSPFSTEHNSQMKAEVETSLSMEKLTERIARLGQSIAPPQPYAQSIPFSNGSSPPRSRHSRLSLFRTQRYRNPRHCFRP